jgi:NitT/TauT family transport system ATP-binding protein
MSERTPDVVVARDVGMSYPTKDGQFQALDQVSLTVGEGKLVSIVGPSGCGKSTLLQIIGGLATATTGEAQIDGVRIAAPNPDKIGIVFQEPLLSGGMRQRVAIARGLVRKPRLLLMDEPFAALDEQTRTRMWGELLQIRAASRATIVFVTHSLVEAVYLADEVLVMAAKPGRIVERIAVDLPQPRSLDMLGSPVLGALRNRIWNLIAEPQP